MKNDVETELQGFIGFKESRSLSNYQCHVNVHLRYTLVQLYKELRTIVLEVIQDPTANHLHQSITPTIALKKSRQYSTMTSFASICHMRAGGF